MTAEVITIGDEILFGQITDTNTQYISEELSKIGIKTVRKSSVGDTEAAILEVLNEAARRAKIIIITGGLGPTKDDITKLTLAKYFGVGMAMHQPTLDLVTEFFTKRGRTMIDLNTNQANVPINCEVLMNSMGTAPGMWFDAKNTIYISLPGVPYEMKHLMQTSVLDKLKAHFELPFIVHKMIHTVGMGESFLAEQIKDWEDALPSHIKLAYLPSLGIVKLRLTGQGTDKGAIQNEIDQQVKKLTPMLGTLIFGYDENGKLESAIGTHLKDKNYTLAIAESCTGGYLSHLITSISGSSAYFKGAIVSYANEIKTSALDISDQLLVEYGAVSEQVAIAMAENVCKKLNTDVGIATTGIAGPEGGTVEKPVGTIWMAFSHKGKTVAKKMVAGSSRENNIRLFAIYALNFARLQLGH
ncbi:MAG: competence/damage-inducible protein A [Cytophagales bacterium]